MIDITLASEDAVLIRFADEISPDLPQKIQHYCQLLELYLSDFIIELLPSYTTILLYHYPCDAIQNKIRAALENKLPSTQNKTKVIEIPVYYHPSVALDLERLAQVKNLTIEQVVNIHSTTEYQVYAVGFAPAFAYLGLVDPRIALKRLDQPRAKIPAGSVAIANQQTAIYPSESPAGWNIIGRTPWSFSLDNPENTKKFTIGDRVKFQLITKKIFLELGGII